MEQQHMHTQAKRDTLLINVSAKAQKCKESVCGWVCVCASHD